MKQSSLPQHAYVFFVVDGTPDSGLSACAAEWLDAAHDAEAIAIATAVFALIDDTFFSYGLVCGNRTVACGPHCPSKYKPSPDRIVSGQYDQKIRAAVDELTSDFPDILRSPKLRASWIH